MFSAATVPFAVSSDSNFTVKYFSVSGFSPPGCVGSFGPTTFSNTVRAFVSAVKLPFVRVTFVPLWSSTVKAVPSVGFAVIAYVAKSLNATSFVKPLLSSNVTTNPLRSNLSPSVYVNFAGWFFIFIDTTFEGSSPIY